MEERKLTCIGCPMGCQLQVIIKDGIVEKVTGNTCKRGADYGKKEVVKALGTGFAGIDASEVEILRGESGAPYVTLYGAARKKAEEMGITDWKISITNTKEVATAFVIASANDVKE